METQSKLLESGGQGRKRKVGLIGFVAVEFEVWLMVSRFKTIKKTERRLTFETVESNLNLFNVADAEEQRCVVKSLRVGANASHLHRQGKRLFLEEVIGPVVKGRRISLEFHDSPGVPSRQI